MGNAIQAIALELNEAEARRVSIPPIHARLEPKNLDQAYAVQEVNTLRAITSGRRLSGRKIGFTNIAVQKQLGVNEPDYGMLFTDMAVPDGWEISPRELIQPKVEAEIAFVMDREINDERLTIADIISATAYVLPAIEVVDSRIDDWKIDIVDTIADNASAARYVLGGTPKRLDQIELRQCQMKMHCSGTEVTHGSGILCMNDPVTAVMWLARTMAKIGRPLQAGDTVLSGSLGLMVPAEWGHVYDANIAGLGSVRAAFAAPDG